MTNAAIIFEARLLLMDEGVLKPTGNSIQVYDEDGNVRDLEEPEEIHTYQHWKSLGYQVRKGEHAVTKLAIWKHVNGKAQATNAGDDEDDGEPEGRGRMFRKVASFFAASQVDEIPATA